MTGLEHWDEAYARGASAVGWHEVDPVVSLSLIDLVAPAPDDPIIDIGAGAASLVDRLVERRMTDLTVLDLSPSALAVARGRLGAEGDAVAWIQGDLFHGIPPRAYAVWHDRAVFHFLVEPPDRRRYAALAQARVRPGGHAVVGTFALEGPERCSGLPVARYDAEGLAQALGPAFTLVASQQQRHVTPSGRGQAFTWVLLRRDGE